MVEKIKTGVNRLLLVFMMDNKFSKNFVKSNICSFSKPNVVHLHFNFSTISQILCTLDMNVYKPKINKI